VIEARDGLRRLTCAAIVTVSLLAAAPLDGQVLTPKRAVAGGCPEFTLPTSPATPQATARAQELSRSAQQAALTGDPATARDRLGEAASLDPADPEIAYLLARMHEDAGDVGEAVREFCRFLTLAPAAPDAEEARSRVDALAGPERADVSPAATEQFNNALTFFDRGDGRGAEWALDFVIRDAPRFAEAHYNRALVRLDRGDFAGAADDLARYLTLAPGADDHGTVAAAVDRLRGAGAAPSHAFAVGLLVPGLGQWVTRRPMVGVAVLGAVGGAAALGFAGREEVRTEKFLDPFGNPYEERVSVTTRPNRDVGIVAAAAIMVGAAAEAYLHAARHRRGIPVVERGDPRLVPLVGQGQSGEIRVGVTLRR
jgi:Tfp pilus assembly protein PilF